MNTQITIGSLAMDLKRVALGLHVGSLNTAERFKKEALKRCHELRGENDPYLKKLVEKTRKVLQLNEERSAEDALMYSTLFQNLALKNYPHDPKTD